MKARRRLGRACLLAAMLLQAGCAIYGHQLRSVDNALQAGNSQAALAQLEALGRSQRNEVLYLVNKGTLLHMQGDIRGSIAALEAAKPLMEFQEATSVSETIEQFSVVEGSSSYQPRAFERLNLHVLQALNFLEIDDLDAARVEALQITVLMNRLYDGAAPHGGDAFPRYLSGVIFELNREPDAALVAYRKALEAYAGSASAIGIPNDLRRRMLLLTRELGLDAEFEQLRERFPDTLLPERRPRPGDELIVVVSTGLVPRKIEISQVHQDITTGKIYRLSLPDLVSRNSRISQVVARLPDGGEIAADQVADLEGPARATLDAELPGLIARAVARNLVKNRVANEAGEESQGLELFVNFVSAVVENADLRSWSTLPAKRYLMRVPLEPGTQSVALEMQDSAGRVLHTETFDEMPGDRNAPLVRSIHVVRP